MVSELTSSQVFNRLLETGEVERLASEMTAPMKTWQPSSISFVLRATLT
ncbi:MAG: hypothetical protein AABO41_12700 [Acidobacteriota bacterium]